MLEKPTNLNFMDQDVIKAPLVPDLIGDPYSGVECIPKKGTRIVFFINLHNDRTRVSTLFKRYERFMAIKEKETDQDPIESKVSWKLTSYTTHQLN
jgi:hypothetical protein